MKELPTVSVIVPVYSGGPPFLSCLESIERQSLKPLEVIVVFDGAHTIGEVALVRCFGWSSIVRSERGGAAKARNVGASQARGDILLFVDADVTLSRDVIDRVSTFFSDQAEISALFGSYDAFPFEPNFLSQFRNLLHHYVHQNSSPHASTFWSGCGAIRREVFLKISGFDETQLSLEDVELGYRLKEAGYSIELVKDLQVKHLKKWNFSSLVRTDFFERAVPWSRLLLARRGRMINELNLKRRNRLSTALALATCLALPMAFFSWPWLVGMLAMGVLLVALNFSFYLFLERQRGIVFALRSVCWHWFFYVYSGIAFIYTFFLRHEDA